MHEEALVQDLRRKVEELSAGHGRAPILRARVALGTLSHLDERRLRELWPRAMAGGPAAGAALEVELLPGIDHPQASSVVLRSVTFDEPDRKGPAEGGRPTRSSARGG